MSDLGAIMEKVVKLEDGTEILIRHMKTDDLDRSFEFFKALPEEDRSFLRYDVTQRELVRERIRAMETGGVKRIVALAGAEIVADGALELSGHGWKEHVGELRLVVSRSFQRRGLGMVMARALYDLAAAAKVDEVVVKMMRPQVAAQRIFRRLGFHEEILLPEYVKDQKGHKQDLIVMRCDLEALWREMEDYFAHHHLQKSRWFESTY
jgi:ribosomal protein S18 acetylase RimI-like enzyme